MDFSHSPMQRTHSFDSKKFSSIFQPVQVNSAWRIWYNEELYRIYKNTDMVACDMCIEGYKWAGHIVRMFDTRIQKHIVEWCPGGRRPIGEPKNRWHDKAQNDAARLLNTKNWHAAIRKRCDGRKKTEKAIAKKWAECPQEGGELRCCMFSFHSTMYWNSLVTKLTVQHRSIFWTINNWN